MIFSYPQMVIPTPNLLIFLASEKEYLYFIQKVYQSLLGFVDLVVLDFFY